MTKLNIAYFGTPDVSAQFLKKMCEDTSLPIEIKMVVTQPDKPVGRKQILTPSAVKEMARSYDLPIFDEKLTELIPLLKEEKIDVCVLFAFGKMIKEELLTIPKYGFWNIHPSLLPAYRGASPVVYPILLGDTETGVTLMQMDKELDHGPIIDQAKYDILQTTTQIELLNSLANSAFQLFQKHIKNIEHISTHVQNDEKATFTRILTKEDGFIPNNYVQNAINGEEANVYVPKILEDFVQKNTTADIKHYTVAQTIYNMYRALTPWPGIWTKIQKDGIEKRMKLTEIELRDNTLVIKKVHIEGEKEKVFVNNQLN